MRSLQGFLLSVVAFLAVAAPSTHAAIVVLTDENSTASIDTSSQAGMYDWVVDGMDHMSQQWFWYRLGPTAPEQSIDTLIANGVTQTDTDGDSDIDTVNLKYTNSLVASATRFDLEVRFSLRGGEPGSLIATIDESISITNRSNAAAGPASTLDFHFIQYSDYDLNDTPGNDSVFIETGLNGDSAVQSDPGPGLFTVSENAANPRPAHHEAGFYPTTLLKLNDAVASTLNDVAAAGPGDVTWAFQWDVSIAKNRSFNISKNKTVESVPEPSSFAVLALGGIALLRRRR